ncbi:hypothetical protein [Bosea sp. F3-2]|uniref:hypothetical protein n=1 Tax=Bosea sp. F3-2 TaxID=2599640 RepID=UPI001AED27E5|nr:hypothetical protein [Bosea sp. F3-2]
MDLGINGKTALVLGAGGGLGSAIAKALAREGVRVALGDIDPAAAELPGSVLPFILRGVALIGVESAGPPPAVREAAWTRLARDLDKVKLRTMYEVQPFEALPDVAGKVLANLVRGRVVISIAG